MRALRDLPAVVLVWVAVDICAGLLVRPLVSHLPSGRVLVRLGERGQRWSVLVAPVPLTPAVTWLSPTRNRTVVAGGGCLYRGHVVGGPTAGRAALRLCRGVTGLVTAGERTFAVRPAAHALGPHLITSVQVRQLMARHRQRRALLSLAADRLRAPLTGHGGTLVGDQWFASSATNRADAYRLPPSATFLARPRWLELVVVADSSLVAFHGADRVLDYVLTLLNVVSAVMEDASLEARLRVAVTKVYLLDGVGSVVRPGRALSSLRAVNQWAAELADSRDGVLWLTRQPLGGPAGFAPVSGVCDRRRNTALCRAQSLSSAFLVAHEIGHLLGLTHDGDADGCAWAPTLGSVMAPVISATYSRFLWSNCSREEYRRKISWWSCLYNEPTAPGATTVGDSVERPFTLAEQCEMEFGSGHDSCPSPSRRRQCRQLWCSPRNSTRCFARSAPLDGTACGENRWCVAGECRPVHRPESTAESGWGHWTPWGPCSRSCDMGVQRRYRECRNLHNSCEGAGEQFQLCPGLLPCTEDPHVAYCRRQLPVAQWHPSRPNQEFPCHFWCARSKEGGETRGEQVLDGVPCDHSQSLGICVQGRCREVDCNGHITSAPGHLTDKSRSYSLNNGHLCRPEQLLIELVPVTPFSQVARLPRGARHVTIMEMVPSPHRVAIFDRTRDRYLINGDVGRRVPGSYHEQGLSITYEVSDYSRERIAIQGMLRGELDVQVQSSSFVGQIVLNITFYPPLVSLKTTHGREGAKGVRKQESPGH